MKNKVHLYLTFFAVAVLFAHSTATLAAPPSPFIGNWQAIDVDGSEMTLSIAGRPNGPFQITWTDNFISFCNGEAGIIRGTGWLNESDSNLLEVDVHLECFTTGATLDFHVTLRYHPVTNTLSIQYWFGQVTIWHHPGRPQTLPPALNLRVNYGHDWVESFYAAGHTAWVTVTDSDGNVKATSELVTEPKDYWGGEPGFQSMDSIWFDADGNPMEYPPDIQPYDWVFGWVDNGASAQMQIGEISGTIDLNADSIEGTINSPWFSDQQLQVEVECHPWGAPDPTEMKFDTILPDGSDPYFCSWAGEWDIQYYQDVGVGYFGPDGHWVANAFFVPNPHFTVFPEWEYLEGYEWPDGALVSISVDGKEVCSTSATAGYPEWDPNNTFLGVNFPEGCDLALGDVVTASDGVTTRTHTVRNLAISSVDEVADTVAGTSDPGEMIYVWPHETGQQIETAADEYGSWMADFNGIYDIQPGSGGRSEIRDDTGNATAVDWYVPNPRFTVFPEWNYLEGYEWPDGTLVSISVDGKEVCSTSATAGYPEWDPNNTFLGVNFPEGCDLVVGDVVTASDGVTTRTHTVRNLTISSVDEVADTVAGTSDPGEMIYVWPHETGQQIETAVDEYGSWLADFNGIYDIRPGSGGRSEIRDDTGNATAVEWYIPDPHFTVFPLWEWYDAMDWPEGATVNITVEGKPVCNFHKESPGNFFNGGFPAGCDIAAGDTVTFTDNGTTRTHVVRNLAITNIDLGKDTISGLADAGAPVYVWPHDAGFEPLQAIANDQGEWQVDLGDVGYDILEGASGRSEIRDDMGNATAVDWNLNARIIVHTTDDWFRAEGFMPNTSLDFWIYDAFGSPLLESTTAQTDSGGTITHWVGDQMDIVPGNYVIVTDGTSTRELALEALTFEVFDTTLGILQGTAPEPFGRTVSVGIGCWARDDLTMDVTTDENGGWIVDFGVPIPDDYGCVFAWIYDADGDASEARPERVVGFWAAALTYDLLAGTLTDGTYPYHFELEWSIPEPGSFSGQGGELIISSGAPTYDGYVLLRGPMELRRVDSPEGPVCEEVGVINPQQPMRFLIGWVPDPMTYEEALDFFESLEGVAVWDGTSAELTRHDIVIFSWDDLDSWFQYACTFTE